MKIEGKTVHDGRKGLVIDVQQRDLRMSSRKDPAHCVIAQCVKRHFGAQEAYVHLTRTYVKINDKWHRYYTPNAMRRQLIDFDHGKGFSPGEYELLPIRPSHRKGYDSRKQKSKAVTGKKRKQRVVVHNVRGGPVWR